MKRVVEWYEHPTVEELDGWFEEEVAKGALRDEYLNLFSGASCIADLKHELGKWVNNIKEDLDMAVEILGCFPLDDETCEEYEGDE